MLRTFNMGIGLIAVIPAEKIKKAKAILNRANERQCLIGRVVGGERKGLAFGWYNFAIGIATLPASLIFGALYQVYGALAAFGWGATLALVAVVLLLGVKGQRHPKLQYALERR